MAEAGVYDLKVNQGATFVLGLTLKKVTGLAFDLTGYTARSQIRRTYASPYVIGILHVAFDASRKSGKFSLSLSESETSTLPLPSCVYDVELIDGTGTVVTRILQGKVLISPQVTRPLLGISGYSGYSGIS